MTNEPTAHYVHGTTPEEQRRLTLLNRLLNESSLRALGLRGGERVLDVGCGLAQFSRAIARAAGPGARVLGIERSSEQIEEALRQARAAGEEGLIEIRQGDALALPLRDGEWGAFDLAHARFVLEHLPDPLGLVRQMVRAVCPGGRVVLEDDDHDVLRLWPEPAGADAVWRAYIHTYERNGNDPYVGRKLVSLLHEAGAAPARNGSLSFGSCSGNPDFPAFVENLCWVLMGAREAILSTGMLDGPATLDHAVRAIREWGERPDAAFWYATSWAEGVRPE